MKTYLKELLSLNLAVLIGVLAVGCGPRQGVETSSETIDGTEYRKALRATDDDKRHDHVNKVTIKISKGAIAEATLNKSAASFALKRRMPTTVKFDPDRSKRLAISENKLILPTNHMKKRTFARSGQIGYDAKSRRLVIFAEGQEYKNGFYLLGSLQRAVPEAASLVKTAGKAKEVRLSVQD